APKQAKNRSPAATWRLSICTPLMRTLKADGKSAGTSAMPVNNCSSEVVYTKLFAVFMGSHPLQCAQVQEFGIFQVIRRHPEYAHGATSNLCEQRRSHLAAVVLPSAWFVHNDNDDNFRIIRWRVTGEQRVVGVL